MTAIVIPAADIAPGSAGLLQALLFSIEKGGYLPRYPVVVCFDECRDEFIQRFVVDYPFITPIINKGNRKNFAGNANDGLRYVYGELTENAVVVNQDCVLPNVKVFDQLWGYGIVVPNPVQLCKEPPIDLEDLARLDKSQPQEVQKSPQLKLVGFCMFLSYNLMTRIGFFDEHFKATFEDDDICARALLAKLPVEHVNVNVQHYTSRCGAYDGNRLAINLMKFREKWSIPQEVEHANFNQWIVEHHKWHPNMREN